jgi:hypothetical protein
VIAAMTFGRSTPPARPLSLPHHRNGWPMGDADTLDQSDLLPIATFDQGTERMGAGAMSEPIDSYFTWVEDGRDGREDIIAAIVPGVPSGEPTPLQDRWYEFVSKLRPLAEQHAKASGHKARLWSGSSRSGA